MDYDFLLKRLGRKFNIVNGDLVEAEDGKFLVTTDFVEYAICLNPITKTWNVIAPKKSYLARQFNLRHSDCISLNFEWLDDHYGTNYTDIYKNTRLRDFYRIFTEGLAGWYSKNGFNLTNTAQVGDTLIYAWQQDYISHVATYLGNNKILHHVPQKLSSIDEYDSSKVKGIFRYASNS